MRKKPSLKLTISLISIYKHCTIDIPDPSSIQDACHMNFVIDLAHRGLRIYSFSRARDKTKKTSFSIFEIFVTKKD